MRAVVFAAVGELTVAERPEPVPGPREVVIETAAVGICGTDTHVLDGEFEGTVFRWFRPLASTDDHYQYCMPSALERRALSSWPGSTRWPSQRIWTSNG